MASRGVCRPHIVHTSTPTPSAGKDGKDGEAVTEIAGEYVARALFSRNWQLREAALGFLGGMAQGGGLGDKRDAFRTLAKAVQVCGGGGDNGRTEVYPLQASLHTLSASMIRTSLLSLTSHFHPHTPRLHSAA